MFEVDGIMYAGSSSKDILKIIDAKVTGDMMMLITFSSGEKRVFDAQVFTGEVFEPLKDKNVFSDFKISHGVVTWMNGEIDCAPEYMYANSYSYNDAALCV
jgi:hypothetical protein